MNYPAYHVECKEKHKVRLKSFPILLLQYIFYMVSFYMPGIKKKVDIVIDTILLNLQFKLSS